LVKARESGQRERVLHLHHTPQGEEYVNIELAPLLDENGEQAFFIERMESLPVAKGRPSAQGLIGRSNVFQNMLGLVARVAPSMATVMLLGESGTGKELLAQALHAASGRAHRALVAVDCSSLPESLFESELFGHERGAFTGANVARGGLVEAASGGTLFLDEVGDIPLLMQVKLLRLLETGTYRRVGSTEPRHADIRVVCATHRDLTRMVQEGTFREDLYYRLSTFPIHLPPLRDRQEDVELLAQALLERVAPQRKLQISALAMVLLKQQRFPGNVRELRNLLERTALLCDGDRIEHAHMQQALTWGGAAASQPEPHPTARLPQAGTLKDRERLALQQLVSDHKGSKAELAASLGISERSLYRKLRALE
jgi:DNA-binding NtrC family response regulator